jgi:hypothetical protein
MRAPRTPTSKDASSRTDYHEVASDREAFKQPQQPDNVRIRRDPRPGELRQVLAQVPARVTFTRR